MLQPRAFSYQSRVLARSLTVIDAPRPVLCSLLDIVAPDSVWEKARCNDNRIVETELAPHPLPVPTSESFLHPAGRPIHGSCAIADRAAPVPGDDAHRRLVGVAACDLHSLQRLR